MFSMRQQRTTSHTSYRVSTRFCSCIALQRLS